MRQPCYNTTNIVCSPLFLCAVQIRLFFNAILMESKNFLLIPFPSYGSYGLPVFPPTAKMIPFLERGLISTATSMLIPTSYEFKTLKCAATVPSSWCGKNIPVNDFVFGN